MDIQAQSAHVETVKRSTSNGIYYVCIVLEVIALIVLLAIVFGVVKTN